MQTIKVRNIRIVASPKHTGAFIVKYDEASGAPEEWLLDIEREIPCHNYATALWEKRNLEKKSS